MNFEINENKLEKVIFKFLDGKDLKMVKKKIKHYICSMENYYLSDEQMSEYLNSIGGLENGIIHLQHQ